MLQMLVAPDLSVGRSVAATPPFGVSVRDGGLDAVWVRVVGELDVATAPRLAQTLRSAELCARGLVLDLRELTFMDCGGMRVIVNASVRARQAGCRLVIVRGPSLVDRVFKLTAAAAALEIIDLYAADPPVQKLAQIGANVVQSPAPQTSRTGFPRSYQPLERHAENSQ
jgi:anti-sigma B factor antagonist